MNNGSSFMRSLRSRYRKRVILAAIIGLIIGLAAGFFGGKLLDKNQTDAPVNPVLTMPETQIAAKPETKPETESDQFVFDMDAEPEAESVFASESEAEPEITAAESEALDAAESEAARSLTAAESESEGGALKVRAAQKPAGETAVEAAAEATEEPAAEPTAVPTAEPTPEPTAEPTPEVTPEPTPEPTPEVTPEPTPIIVPYGEAVTIESQITMDGGPRRDASNTDFETLDLTVQLLSYKDFDYFEKNYGNVYDLKGGTAAAEFNITLNNYAGSQQIIPQNCLLITFRGEDDTKATQGYQLIDKEIAGSTGVMLINNQPVTCYKRYAYDETLGEMKYMVLTAYNNGGETTYWFDIKAPEPDPTPTPEPTALPDVSHILHPGDTSDAVKQLQEALITQGFLDSEATGYYGEKTYEAVRTAQQAFGLDDDGIAGKQFFRKIYNMEID